MKTVLLEINDDKAYKAIEDLAEQKIITVLRNSEYSEEPAIEWRKTRFSINDVDGLSDETAAKILQHIKEGRGE
ncbi:MAG: hypothetical protein V4543_03915 [Bacteroidota bacterium]